MVINPWFFLLFMLWSINGTFCWFLVRVSHLSFLFATGVFCFMSAFAFLTMTFTWVVLRLFYGRIFRLRPLTWGFRILGRIKTRVTPLIRRTLTDMSFFVFVSLRNFLWSFRLVSCHFLFLIHPKIVIVLRVSITICITLITFVLVKIILWVILINLRKKLVFEVAFFK